MTRQRNDNYFSFPGFHGISATTLKLIAVVTMFIDHFAAVFETELAAQFLTFLLQLLIQQIPIGMR